MLQLFNQVEDDLALSQSGVIRLEGGEELIDAGVIDTLEIIEGVIVKGIGRGR